ncbi:aminoglycoside 6'-N-acetyltransferase [Parasphingorhabdus marina DSM 22363]|uniref:Aminoglycoside 6'-N-acetyltransferase n=1 Tax=Parasphingorhabdus marina DSM 22363 TaxID=1123272 RepID=A0A1N6H0N4_9SPHN|nr:GNAT family N-acetyltransferase [Parasphingorhabdus marina]SIO13354.1 aminoglycoside 6'-N-acetyltransferase [Parasphingorhabdus marina DSM 22363]
MVTPLYEFGKATTADLELLLEWQAPPHVSEWWDTVEPADARDLNDPRVDCRIVSLAGRPFAYMQDYRVHGWDNHHFLALPEGTRGIDQFIGEPDLLAKGHGSGFIAQRLKALFEDGAPVVATDPHPDNSRAIAAYRKAGFSESGPPQDTPWGWILPMEVRP